MPILDILATTGLFLWDLFKQWLWMFAAPFTKLEAAWFIIPVWLSWFFTEFFSEKKQTSFGDAISNGVVPFWIGFDWMRYTTGLLIAGNAFSFEIFQKYLLSAIALAYGFFIIYNGIQGKAFVHFAGRIREITYVLVMFMPIIYDIVPLTWKALLAILLYFPLFYFLIELIDHYTPDPKIFSEGKGGAENSFGEFSSNSAKDEWKF